MQTDTPETPAANSNGTKKPNPTKATPIGRDISDAKLRALKHVVPLPQQAVSLLRGMQTVTGHRQHVFPHRDNRHKPMVVASFRQMLHVLGWSGKFSPHAARTTGSTRLNEMGFPPDWIERQLAHAEPNRVRATYNQADYFNGRAQMMQRWADLLDELKAGKTNVVPINREGKQA